MVVVLGWVVKPVQEAHGQAVVVVGVVVGVVFLAVVAVADSHEQPSLPATTVLHEQVVVDGRAIAPTISPCIVPDPRILQPIVSQGVLQVGEFRNLMDLVIILIVRNWYFLPIIGYFITNEVSVQPFVKLSLDFIHPYN